MKGALAKKLYYADPPYTTTVSAPKKRKKGWRNLATAAICFLSGITVIVIVYLGICTQIVQDQFALDHYQAMLPTLRENNANFEVQVKQLSSPSRIDKIARTQLHMDLPKSRLLIQDKTYTWIDNLEHSKIL